MPFFLKKRRQWEDLEKEPTERKAKEFTIKLLVIGATSTGKTSIIQRYVHNCFSREYKATIGVEFALKVLHWDENTIVRIQLWDIAGQERYSSLVRAYYKGAHGALIVSDVTRPSTMDAVSRWHDDLRSKVQLFDGSPLPCVLLANKCDQKLYSLSDLKDLCNDRGFLTFFETSAKRDINITEAVTCLIDRVLKNERGRQRREMYAAFQDSISLTNTQPSAHAHSDRKNRCC